MHVNVYQDEFKVVKRNSTISTEGAGPCIIVGIYDKKKKTAYLLHEQFARMSDTFTDFIKCVRTNSDPENLDVYVRGGSIFTGIPNDEKNDLKENREFVLEKLNEFLKQTQVDGKWAKKDTESKMFIEARTGQVLYEF